MKRINYFMIAVAISLLASSCGVTYENVPLQVMQKSRSGLDLRQKSMAAYLLYFEKEDSTALCNVMSDFIGRMSVEYSIPINLYAQPVNPGTDYSDRDTLAAMVTEANSDVIFVALPDSREKDAFGSYGFRIFIYDSMLKADKVYNTPRVTADSIFVSQTSQQLVNVLGPVWQTGYFRILTCSGNKEWNGALDTAVQGLWTSAIDKWIKILEATPNSIQKRMALEYNIALGCYLTNNYALADKWVQQAKSDCTNSYYPDYLKNLEVLIKQSLK